MQFDVSGDVPAPRGGHAAVPLNNRLLIIGGHNSQGPLADLFFLDNVDNFSKRRNATALFPTYASQLCTSPHWDMSS